MDIYNEEMKVGCSMRRRRRRRRIVGGEDSSNERQERRQKAKALGTAHLRVTRLFWADSLVLCLPSTNIYILYNSGMGDDGFTIIGTHHFISLLTF